jgi:hypothetical protein
MCTVFAIDYKAKWLTYHQNLLHLRHPVLDAFLIVAGTIVFELYWKHAPKTCQNFYELVIWDY